MPADKLYLLKYFRTSVERAFLVYYLMFRDDFAGLSITRMHRRFLEHTGHVCSDKWVYRLMRRVRYLEHEVEAAIRIGSPEALDQLTIIKTGKLSPLAW